MNTIHQIGAAQELKINKKTNIQQLYFTINALSVLLKTPTAGRSQSSCTDAFVQKSRDKNTNWKRSETFQNMKTISNDGMISHGMMRCGKVMEVMHPWYATPVSQ